MSNSIEYVRIDSETLLAVDASLCVLAGQCSMIAPEAFDQDLSEGTVRVLPAASDESQAEDVRDAVAVCPSGALALVRDTDG